MSCIGVLPIIEASVGISMVILAALALNTWRKQDAAKRAAEFLDALIDATHGYIAEMSAPIMIMEMEAIGMESRAPSTGEDSAVQGAIAYIEEHGREGSRRLFEALHAAQSKVVRLRSLAAKGQVFNFAGYESCQNAVAMMTWQFDRLEVFALVLGSPNLNWNHPDVMKQIDNVMNIRPDEVRKALRDTNSSVLKFAIDAERRLYGRRKK